jgi:hypothetical protein
MPRYCATFRALYDADDDVQAIFIADKIRENGGEDLDIEEGEDTFENTQVTSSALAIEPEEIITHLRKARNILINTRFRQCFDLAREMDKQIWCLIHRDDVGVSLSNYDYGRFMEIAKLIINEGKVPHD